MFGKDKKKDKYKFKSLNSYSWSDVVAGKKKFRKVFDRVEISYLSTELAFYNKMFDESEWKTSVTIKAYTLEKGEKTSSKSADKTPYRLAC